MSDFCIDKQYSIVNIPFNNTTVTVTFLANVVCY